MEVKRETEKRESYNFLCICERVKAPGAILLFSEMKDDDDHHEKVVKLK